MKKYIGTKIIEAKKAEKDGRKGYAVRYKDGYESWSPLEAFEEAYHCIDDGLTFGEAIQLMKKGAKIARKGWNGKGQYVQLATGISYKTVNGGDIVNCEHEAIGNKAIAFIGTSGVQMGWLASQADMLAEDWYVVE